MLASALTGVLTELSPQRAKLAFKNVLGNPQRSEEKFRVVLCWLENDPKEINRRTAVEPVFSNIGGIELVRSACIVKASGAADDQCQAMQRNADAVLKNWDADLAIIGLVKKTEESLSLWFVPRSGKDTLSRGDKPYKLEDATLGKDFHKELRARITAMAWAAVAPLADSGKRGQLLDKELRNAIEKLSTLLESPAIASSQRRTALQAAYGIALFALGKRERETEHLKEAVAVYHRALEVFTRERVPANWAVTQNNLGVALFSLGDRENDTERLKEAIAAYHAALEVRTREHAPLDWATTQNNLGSALVVLGKCENGTERLEQAVEAYRGALEVFTRERAPDDWAITQNNLGIALVVLGKRENGTERLEEAVAAYHEALEVYTRKHAPLDWAITQNSLGSALQTLGERESETERLKQAVAAYRGALEVFTRKHTPLNWAMTQSNLGNALRVLGERESETERLEQAVAAYNAALEVFTDKETPLYKNAKPGLEQALRKLRSPKP